MDKKYVIVGTIILIIAIVAVGVATLIVSENDEYKTEILNAYNNYYGNDTNSSDTIIFMEKAQNSTDNQTEKEYAELMTKWLNLQVEYSYYVLLIMEGNITSTDPLVQEPMKEMEIITEKIQKLLDENPEFKAKLHSWGMDKYPFIPDGIEDW
ncbi:hypothetical protein [Methanobrevibacter sp. DSM 116169]|uniref:hypothetical protein n=1 Tax=Methanobrevibacter sp. DSM 116169 TaxID=3242727 RepID=UPI0038FD3512